jgi:hypothetical protein
MDKPAIVLTSAAAWVDVLMQRIHHNYRPIVYTERENYVARLADDNAAMIFVDGDADGWRFWTTTPKTSPATRRIPVVVVANSASVREEALVAGANLALSLTELMEQLSDLLEMARVVDPAAAAEMQRQCDESMPADGLLAIEKFNRGDYYKQHDLFEAMWMAEKGPIRDLYRAILQVGIAYYQITRGNQRGAYKMLLRSIQWLGLLPDVCQGVDVAQLKADAARVRAELERVGADGIAQFDHSLLKPIKLVQPSN